METPTDHVPARPMHPLAAFVRLWSMSVIVRNYARLRVDLSDPLSLAVCCASLLASAWPASPPLLLAAVGLRVTQIWRGVPYVYDTQCWCLLWDAALLLNLLLLLASRQRLTADRQRPHDGQLSGQTPGGQLSGWTSRFSTLSEAEQWSILEWTSRTNVAQMAMCYFACGFWKLNSAFLHPSYSCAPILFSGHVAQWMPALSPATNAAIGRALPPMTIVTECGLGVLLLFALGRRLNRIAFAALCA